MNVFYEFVRCLFLFAFGATVGWCIEVVFRTIKNKKLINPGFLSGPALPIYGFGVVVLHYFSNMPLDFIDKEVFRVLFIFAIVMVAMTLIEFIAGLIFIKGMKLKLWDYSRRPGNIMGIICPLFTLIWGACGIAYYFLINPWLKIAAEYCCHNVIAIMIIGIWYGIFIVDLGYSIHIGSKIKAVKGKLQQAFDWDGAKERVAKLYKEQGKRRPFFFTASQIYKIIQRKNANNETNRDETADPAIKEDGTNAETSVNNGDEND